MTNRNTEPNKHANQGQPQQGRQAPGRQQSAPQYRNQAFVQRGQGGPAPQAATAPTQPAGQSGSGSQAEQSHRGSDGRLPARHKGAGPISRAYATPGGLRTLVCVEIRPERAASAGVSYRISTLF